MSASPWGAWGKAGILPGQTMRQAEQVDASPLPTVATFPLVQTEALGDSHNPSVAVHDGRLMAVVRVIREGVTTNVLGEIYDRRFIAGQLMKTAVASRAPQTTTGFEDCRLFSFDGALWAAATFRSHGTNLSRMAVISLTSTGHFGKVSVQPSDVHEKNWMPVVDREGDKDRLRFVYRVEPLIVVTWNRRLQAAPGIPENVPVGVLRGSSQLVPFEGGWVSVVHESCGLGSGSPATYTHRFVRFDRELTAVSIGRPFYFQKRGIEFCAGLAPWKNVDGKDVLVLSYGLADRQAFAAEVALETVEAFLEPSGLEVRPSGAAASEAAAEPEPEPWPPSRREG